MVLHNVVIEFDGEDDQRAPSAIHLRLRYRDLLRLKKEVDGVVEDAIRHGLDHPECDRR